MKRRWIAAGAIVVAAVSAAHGALSATQSVVPKNGFVPDAASASRIAEAVWIPIYGEEMISSEKPFKVSLHADVWTVTGKDLPDGRLGGVAEADISKRDGRILRVVHGR
jgi:NTF2 fold immunity protein of polymorphic toxin system component